MDSAVPNTIAEAYVAWADNLAPRRNPDFFPEQYLQNAQDAVNPAEKSLQYVWAASAFLSQTNYVGGAEPIKSLLSKAANYRVEAGLDHEARELESLANGAEHIVRISSMYRSEVLGLEKKVATARKVPDFSANWWLRGAIY